MNIQKNIEQYIHNMYGTEFNVELCSNSSIKVSNDLFFIVIPESLLLDKDIKNIIIHSMIQGLNIKENRTIRNKRNIENINKINIEIEDLISKRDRSIDFIENRVISDTFDNGVFVSEIR